MGTQVETIRSVHVDVTVTKYVLKSGLGNPLLILLLFWLPRPALKKNRSFCLSPDDEEEIFFFDTDGLFCLFDDVSLFVSAAFLFENGLKGLNPFLLD